MNIIIWSPNYTPELIGIPPLVTDFAEFIGARGHAVTVITALPNYPDRRILPAYRGRFQVTARERGVEVRRSWLRVRPRESFVDKTLYEISFAATSTPGVLARLRRTDLIICVVPTMLTAATGSLLTTATRTGLALWVQDLVLGAAKSVGDLSQSQMRLLRAMHHVERFAVARARSVVSCSPGFRPYLEGLGAQPGAISVIPNWVDTDRIVPFPPPSRDRVRVLYTGNIGYTQGLETLVAAVRSTGTVDLDIVGAGNARQHVDAVLGGLGHVMPPVPKESYGHLLGSADILAVVQRSVAANTNLPSKIASYLAAGRPIVASIDLTTPAADVLRESGAALVVPAERPQLLASAIRELRDNPELRARLGANGRRYAQAHLAKDIILRRLECALLGA